MQSVHPFFEFSAEVKLARAQNKPILALESTLITHGLPYPHNIETAKECEQIARNHGVTPATIAILNGKIKIGLSAQELQQLIADKKSIKASVRDLPFAISQGLSAGTTVAATMFCAHKAGIRVFATGGIGGVHRGNENDISADLIELARTPVAVVCSGAKSILDLPRTLEYLETMSIPLIGYQTAYLPAFYSAKTTYALGASTNDIATLAKFIHTHWQLGLNAGVLVANPIPVEHDIPSTEIEPVIANAILLAEKNKITGKAITPFLLNEVRNATQGKSMQANLALIKNNVKVGAELAIKLSDAQSI